MAPNMPWQLSCHNDTEPKYGHSGDEEDLSLNAFHLWWAIVLLTHYLVRFARLETNTALSLCIYEFIEQTLSKTKKTSQKPRSQRIAKGNNCLNKLFHLEWVSNLCHWWCLFALCTDEIRRFMRGKTTIR